MRKRKLSFWKTAKSEILIFQKIKYNEREDKLMSKFHLDLNPVNNSIHCCRLFFPRHLFYKLIWNGKLRGFYLIHTFFSSDFNWRVLYRVFTAILSVLACLMKNYWYILCSVIDWILSLLFSGCLIEYDTFYELW